VFYYSFLFFLIGFFIFRLNKSLGLPSEEKMKHQMPPEFDPVNNGCRNLHVSGLSPQVTEPLMYEIFSIVGKEKRQIIQITETVSLISLVVFSRARTC
jgi:hypothetical protein